MTQSNIYRTTLTILLIITSTALFGQNSWQLVSSAGGLSSNQFTSSEFSIGELVVGNSDNSNSNLFTYGYNQGKIENIPTELINKQVSSVALYPNPTTDAFQINGIEGLASLSILDISGKQVLAKQVTANENVSVSSLPQGVYIVRISTAEGSVEKKLIKK